MYIYIYILYILIALNKMKIFIIYKLFIGLYLVITK